MEEEKNNRKRNVIRYIAIIILILVICWFAWTLSEYNRVKNDKRPIVCFNEKKDIEDDDEYSKVCYGILYKYKEYYYTESNKMSARELTLFFTDFKREVDDNEIK